MNTKEQKRWIIGLTTQRGGVDKKKGVFLSWFLLEFKLMNERKIELQIIPDVETIHQDGHYILSFPLTLYLIKIKQV